MILAVLFVVPLLGTPGLVLTKQEALDSSGGRIPARFHPPHVLQAAATEYPNGRSAMLVSGSGFSYLSGDVPLIYHTSMVTVGRDGSYRLLRFSKLGSSAGATAILSPDGRYVLAEASLEDLLGLHRHRTDDRPELAVADLVTGKVRRYGNPLGADSDDYVYPVAWSPSGKEVLVLSRPKGTDESTARDWPRGWLWAYDLATGHARKLIELPSAEYSVGFPVAAAFSPDGKSIAVEATSAESDNGQRDVVKVVDAASGAQRELVRLVDGSELAGRAAWTPDGASIALITGYNDADSDKIPGKGYRLDLVDAVSGQPRQSPAFDRFPGSPPQFVGWTPDGSAIISRGVPYDHPKAADSADAVMEVIALAPGGGTRQLFDDVLVGADSIDLAPDLVRAGAFGGPAPKPDPWPVAPWARWYPLTIGACIALVARLASWHQRRRTRPPLRERLKTIKKGW
jgi:Tol biopolymer transport system component